jgi:hypothetical protein
VAWAGWGAGPAGAGAAGGPGKAFLVVLAVVSGVVAGLLLRGGEGEPGLLLGEPALVEEPHRVPRLVVPHRPQHFTFRHERPPRPPRIPRARSPK